MLRNVMLAGAAVAAFAVTAFLLWRFIPGPLTEGDYLIIGCLSTLAALLVLFVVVISTWVKAPDPFFKKRKSS